MTGLSFALVLQSAILAADPQTYETAFKESQTRDQPLVVLVGAKWCPGCQTMKQSVMPALARRGGLKAVSYATVDTDLQPALASQLMRGGTIPQLIIFSKKTDGQWKREQITGSTSESAVQALIARGISAHQQTAQTAGGGGN